MQQQPFRVSRLFLLFNFPCWKKPTCNFLKPVCFLFCQAPDKFYKQTRLPSLAHEINFISRLSIKWAKIPTPKHRESFHFVYPPKTWVTHVFSHPGGNVRSCNHTAAVKNLFQSWRKSLKAVMTGIISRSLAPSFSFRVGCTLRLMNFPRVTGSFLATKKGCSESMHLLCVIKFAFPFSWCDVL